MNKKEILGLCEFLKLHGYENTDNISKFIFGLQQENKQLKSIIYELREYMSDIDYKMGWQYVEYLDRLLPEKILKEMSE